MPGFTVRSLILGNILQYVMLLKVQNFITSNCSVVGFGKTEEGYPSPYLKEVEVQVATNWECSYYGGHFSPITDAMICAGGDMFGDGSCQVSLVIVLEVVRTF